MQRLKLSSILFCAAIFILNFSGCATNYYSLPQAPSGIPGVYHRVKAGETLFRISKTYNMDLEELVRINRIADATNIDIGQLVFIPHRQKQIPVARQYGEDFSWPVRGALISTFGLKVNNMVNKGINIQAHPGTDVLASRSGKVVFCDSEFLTYGKTVIIDHGDNFLTVYARNSQLLVKPGDQVNAGSVIAKVGFAGRDRGAYLHFEIRKNGRPQNPLFYLPR